MVVVAVAGTGGVGRTVVDAIVAAGKHHLVVLSRKAAAEDPRRIAVDYDNVDYIKQVLQENKVEVIVSTILLADEAAAQSQINLIRAAAQSGTVDRFIPSEYYIDFHAPIPGSDLFVELQIQAEEELARHPQLTWTLIRCGIFLDHLVGPHRPKKSYITPFWAFVDIDHERCVFPGDGAYPLILSHSIDVAAYIERLVGLPAREWPIESLVASNKLEVKDLDILIKKVTGKPFNTTWDPEPDILKGKVTPLPSNEAVFNDPVEGDKFREVELQIMCSMFSRAHDLPGKDLAELFPEVQKTDIEDFFRAGWALKQSAASK